MEDQSFERLVNTWQKSYVVILGNTKKYKIRLKQLETWDNSNNNKLEHAAKIQALKNLIKAK